MDTDGVADAIAALAGQRHSPRAALGVVPATAGLYAIYASPDGWTDLEFSPGASAALYVGKAEKSFVDRDLHDHFETGSTGWSTVRRSLAALLRDRLSLVAVPRSLSRPDGSANYGLEPEGDQRLTGWMHRHLTLAIWEKPSPQTVLDSVETAVIRAWRPPLNIRKNPEIGRAHV